ncbi:Hypothetical protein CINCED_3A011010 [Cinara cedri]|nr:Hypothetical protein CINCED_3A011010 [Cinara cedri]
MSVSHTECTHFVCATHFAEYKTEKKKNNRLTDASLSVVTKDSRDGTRAAIAATAFTRQFLSGGNSTSSRVTKTADPRLKRISFEEPKWSETENNDGGPVTEQCPTAVRCIVNMMITETAASANATVLPSGGGKIKRSSFKSRGGGSAQIAGAGSVRGYRAVRVTVPSTTVAELASKFNAVVVVNAETGTTTRDIIKKVNKTLAKGAAVRATVEKFESAAGKKHDEHANGGDGTGSGGGGNHIVVVRTNSDHRRKAANCTAVEQQRRLRPQELPQQSATSSIAKQRTEQFQNGKTVGQKPSVLGPKPNLINSQRPDELRTAPAVTAKPTMDHRLFNKHKRLSIARDPDARLESVLNATSPEPIAVRQQSQSAETERASPQKQQLQPQPMATARSSPPEIQPKPNSSFLHNRKRPTPADDVDERRDAKQEPPLRPFVNAVQSTKLPSSPPAGRPELPAPPLIADESDVPSPRTAVPGNGQPKSFIHEYKRRSAGGDHNYHYITAGEPPQAIYEELCDMQISAEAPDPSPLPDVVLESSYYTGTAGAADRDGDHYTTIEGGEDSHVYEGGDEERNFYDDVMVAAAAAAAAVTATYASPSSAAAVSGSEGRKRPVDEDTDYETVEAPPPLPPPHNTAVLAAAVSQAASPQPFPVVDGDDDGGGGGRPLKKELSDSLVDIDNSIYGLNTPSESTSSGITSDSVSAADPNGKYDLDEEWIDVDNTSDELQEIILYHPKPKMHDKVKNGWSIHVRKQLTKVYKSKENTNDISQKIPEEIYADYDSFESDDSWDDYKGSEKLKRVPYPCENRDLPDPPGQQNIYGLVPLVKRAGNRMKKRWSLASFGLNQIRKIGVGNSTTDLCNKTYDSKLDKSNEKKFNSSSKSNSLTSIFYLNDPIYNNIENDQMNLPVRKSSKPPSSIDSRRLSVARPNSPPPPPPVKQHSTGNNSYGSLTNLISNSTGRPRSLIDKSNTDTISENGSNQGSELYMRFADEPLYQFYAADISERTKSVFAGDMMEECDGYEEISSIVSRPSALELITPCLTGHGQHRSLWCEVPEVKNSGIMDTLKPRERKLQEAKFELITSEASYFKSLTVLEKHFVNSHSMNDETILSKNDRKILFGNVNPVRKCSEKLLAALEKCWQDNILLEGLCEIIFKYSKENFNIFVKYCSNQIYIDRTLKSLREKNVKFNEALQRLESDGKCQSLSLHSFLMLPMQRITRLPLLLDAILSKMDPTENSLEYELCELTLASLNTIVQNCNESTRKLERYEEMLLLSQQLEFSSKREIKAMSVASSSRWLVRSGSMLHLNSPDAKLTLSRKFIRPTKLYFFLFNDMFFMAKRKSDENYTVVDYCARNFVQMIDATEIVISSSYKNLLMLTILENHEAKTIEMLLSCDSESSKKRWIEAMSPPISSNPEETLYNEWDCPQVFAEHAYTAVQPDELSLQNGDIVKVLTKMNDGWYHGERIRDGEKGWFPGNYTSEIASQHARAKNLKQRYRLLAMSGSYLQSRQDKIKKK